MAALRDCFFYFPGCRANYLQRKGQPGRGRGWIRGEVRQPLPSCSQRWPLPSHLPPNLCHVYQSTKSHSCFHPPNVRFRLRGRHHRAGDHSQTDLQRSGGSGQQEAGQPLEEARQHSPVIQTRTVADYQHTFYLSTLPPQRYLSVALHFMSHYKDTLEWWCSTSCVKTSGVSCG